MHNSKTSIVLFQKSGYIELEHRIDTDGDDIDRTISILRTLSTWEQLRVTLNWGADPDDLDFHVVEVQTPGPFVLCEVNSQ